ncbi:dolichyl-phosphate beta-glucosyltransferase-like [Limulus polyphemus]|uniref:dolichyl-phosphate beta-glucosyltransferase n=1 Tax=Limulus polyphemus TaxID=6850 RepID=A0ABM1BFF7_LIMPO|nr:dolichyl-phosphate beta-glucosyltransferase-like [Limulus polyphemus]
MALSVWILCSYCLWSILIIGVFSVLAMVLRSLFGSTGLENETKEHEAHYFIDSESKEENIKPPSISDEATLKLSVIVPAFNEAQRLPSMLDECLQYLENRCSKVEEFSYEVVIVSDGSTDDTAEVALQYSRKFGINKVRLLLCKENRGKGAVVKDGMMCSRGKYLLFADADGATKFSDIEKLEESMKDFADKASMVVVVGSRAHLEKESIAQRSVFRTFLMFGFHFVVWLFAVRGIRDTQCGFKLFTREAARLLFPNLHVKRWAFDVELLYLAQYFQIPISEVAVKWTEIEGSKIVPFWSWLQMGQDLFLIWFKYQTGIWQIRSEPQNK